MRRFVWEHFGLIWPLGCTAADRPKSQDRKPQPETRDSETHANWALCRIPAQSPLFYDSAGARDLELAMSTVTTAPNPTPNIPQDDPTSLLPKKLVWARPLFDPEIVRRATQASYPVRRQNHRKEF